MYLHSMSVQSIYSLPGLVKWPQWMVCFNTVGEKPDKPIVIQPVCSEVLVLNAVETVLSDNGWNPKLRYLNVKETTKRVWFAMKMGNVFEIVLHCLFRLHLPQFISLTEMVNGSVREHQTDWLIYKYDSLLDQSQFRSSLTWPLCLKPHPMYNYIPKTWLCCYGIWPASYR